MELTHNLEAIVSHLNDGLYFVDKDRRITLWNAAAERITGYSAEEVVGTKCSDNILVHVDEQGCDMCTHLCPLAATMVDGISRETDLFLHHKNGHRVQVSIRVTPLKDADGKIIGGIELFTDTGSLKNLRERLKEFEELAFIDKLTGLPNRRHMDNELEAQVLSYRRENVPFSILFIDIDHFKRFNDEHGHHVGDTTLKVVADSLAGATRSFDTIGRWGGEEFVAILRNCNDHRAKEVAERLCMLVRHSYVETDDASLQVTVSIGGTVANKQDDAASIIARADNMMYNQKKAGRDGVFFQ